MKEISEKWFETKVQYGKMDEHGVMKTVREQYVVCAVSFSDAEARIVKEMTEQIVTPLEVVDCIREAKYKTVCFSEKSEDDKFYKAKLQFITLDDKSGKEKLASVFYLIQAANFDRAKQYIHTVMDSTMVDYTISSISETPFIDVFGN